jgi:hypothetical protein
LFRRHWVGGRTSWTISYSLALVLKKIIFTCFEGAGLSRLVNVLITNNLFWIVQSAIAESKTGLDPGYLVAEVTSYSKPVGLAVCRFLLFLSSFQLLVHWIGMGILSATSHSLPLFWKMKQSWEHRHANDSLTATDMYATATATDIAPTAEAEGGEGM